MERERCQEIERLYHLALEHEESRRAEFLAQACGGDEGFAAGSGVPAGLCETRRGVHGSAVAGAGGTDTRTNFAGTGECNRSGHGGQDGFPLPHH